MEKKDVVLVVLNRDALEDSVKKLDFDKVNLTSIFTDGYAGKTFNVGGNEIPVITFSRIYAYLWKYRRLKWLIGGGRTEDIRKMRKFFLAYRNIPEDNIISLEVAIPSHAENNSLTLLANLRQIEEHGTDFFVTGNEYAQVGVNLNFIPRVHADASAVKGGVILADANQTLWQSYLTAKHVFKHVKPGTIKFVLIGLAPDSFRRDDDTKIIFDTVTAEQADLNFDSVKATYNKEFSVKAVTDWQDVPDVLPTAALEKNVQILKDYIELCLANGAKPVGVIFPFAPAARKTYDTELLKSFRETIHQLEENPAFTCVDMFELDLNYDCFCDMTHLNARGQAFANVILATKLYEKNLIPVESFCDMNHSYFDRLSKVAEKDDYNTFMERVFEASAKMIRRKDKIRIGFALYLSSQWSGDELYNLFASDKRFETTIFFCKRLNSKTDNKLFKKDFLDGIKSFNDHGLPIVTLKNRRDSIPQQDVIIFLTPYLKTLPNCLNPSNFTVKTLITHIPYAFSVAIRTKSFYNRLIFHTDWKTFFPSVIACELFAKHNSVGMPRGLFSGYPRLDIFFKKQNELNFKWKMARPNAKKIIYAPHWTINNLLTKYSTFQWNYKFMYEFAKAHPEISWVIKPHPGLFFSAVQEGLFDSTASFEKYLQKWNDLPNAQLYTGGYYQNLFATSDGIIHDCGSFIAEYQYVNKPMIYLTRDTQKYNELGNEIMKVSYLVDGKDHDAIAATLQRIIIEGDDYKASERRELFDKYLNYPKINGMLASEFIYHSIADELKEVSE